MTRQIIHQEQHIPASVSRIDSVFRAKVAAARTEAERDSLLRLKAAIKRDLAALPNDEVDGVAREILAQLQSHVRDIVSRRGGSHAA